jgi:hypothetical protein
MFMSTQTERSSDTKSIFVYDMVAKTESMPTRTDAKSPRDARGVTSYFQATPQQRCDQPTKSFDRMAIRLWISKIFAAKA